MLLKFFFLIAAIALPFVQAAVDFTLIAETNGSTVVQACVAKISSSNIFSVSDQQMLRRIAYVETRDGSDSDTYSDTNHGGIWQLSNAKYLATKDTSNSQLQQKIQSISSSFGINWQTSQWSDLRKPFYSALAARLYMQVITASIPLASSLTSQGTYWANYFTSSGGTQSDFVNGVNQLQAIESCSVSSLDLFFVMDASGSVGYSNFQIMKTFVYNIANSFEISSDKVRVGVMSYGSSNTYHFYLNTYSSKSSVLSAINNLPYSGGGTNTAGALDGARLYGFSVSNGARPTNQGVPRVAIIITDGYSNSYSSTVTAATALHNAGIIAFAVGISGANQNELNAIASQSDYVAFISSFDITQLNALQISISQESCVASPDLTLSDNVTDVIGSGETKYLNYPLPNNNMGITLALNVTNGSAVLYASTVVSTPNEAFHDVTIQSNNFEDVYIDPANLTNAANADTVYIAIQGEGASNKIHVSATQGDTSTEPVMVHLFGDGNISASFGQFVSVTCRVTGKPQPTIVWYKNGINLDSIVDANLNIHVHTIDNTTFESVLDIGFASDNDEGVYNCVGMNVLPNGTVIQSRFFTLDVTGVLVVNFTGTAISSTSIYLNWSLPLSGINLGVQYYLVNVIEVETSRSWTFHAVEQHANIISLHPYYNYHCRVAIVGNITYQYSHSIIVTTYQAAPSGAVNFFAPNIVNSTTLNITWSPPPLDQQNGVIRYYIIVITEINTNLTIQIVSNVLWYYINNLHPFYEYSISIAPVTISPGPFSSEVNIVMPEAAPSSAPLNVSISNIDSQTFQVSWQPPNLSHQNGLIREYLVIYFEVDTGNTYNHTTFNQHIIISGVHPFFTYRVRVSAITVLLGPFSHEVTIHTLEDAPSGSPESFNATVTSPYSADLMWDPPPYDQQNGIIVGYVINVTVLETGDSFTLHSNTTSLYVSDLQPFRTFVCIIAALTNSGTGPYSSVFSVKTPQDAPSSPPIHVQANSISSRSLTMTWDPPPYSDQNGIISHYIIQFTEVETNTVTQYMSYTTMMSFSLLHPAYNYYFTIAAYTIALGPYSVQFNCTTEEEAPDQPPSNLIGNVTSSSVFLSWNPPPFESQNGLITSYSVNLTSLESGSNVLYIAHFTFLDINGLAPYTTYNCIVAARTSAGLGPYTTFFSFITNEDAPVASPNITLLYAVNAHSVALQWIPPLDEYHNGIIRKYIVKLQVVGSNNTLAAYHNTTSTTAIIGSLIPSYTYQFSVAAFTVALGPYTAFTTLTLPEDVPGGYPQSLTLNGTTPYSVFLKWTPPLPDEQHGVITGYVINVTHADTLNTIQYHTIQTSINITGLDPYSTYVCVIAAETLIGLGPFSHLFFVQTNEAAPDSPPQHPNAIALSPNSIHITWDPPILQDHNGIIREYRVNVTEKMSGNFTEHAVNQTQLIVTDLKPFHVYQCSIVAVTVDEGPYTVSVSVITKEDAPSLSPQLLSVLVTSSSSLIASWVAPPIESHNGIIRQYIVKVHNFHTEANQSFTTANTMLNISTLSPYTNYSIKVAAYTVKTGPFTIPQEIRTIQDNPTSPPELFNSSVTDSTSLILQWAPPNAEGINGIIQHYNLTVVEQETGLVLYYTTTFLYFYLTNLHPFYTYQCSVAAVTIGVGPIASLIVQMPEDVPASAPLNISIIDLFARMVSISWNELLPNDKNGLIRYYVINITEINTATTSIYQMSSSSLETTLTDLHPYYNYSVSIAAYTIGVGPFSEPTIVTTAQDVPSSSVVNIRSTNEGSTEVTLEWLPPPISQRNGIIIGYNLTVEDTTSDTILIVLSSVTSLNIGSLTPYTTYQCTIAAYTVVGLGPYSSLIFFNTNEAAPSLPPEELNIVDVTSYTVTLSWEIPPIASHNGILRGYTVKVVDTSINDELLVNVTGSTVTLSDLNPYNHYNIAVAAFTTERGPFSAFISVTSLEAVPTNPPKDIFITAIDAFNLSIYWSPPGSDAVNGIVRSYIINVTVMDTLEHAQYLSKNTNYILTELHPYYTYTIYIAAVTIGAGPFSNGYSIQMPQYAPYGKPVNISSVALNSTAVQVYWHPPLYHLQNGVISSYKVMVLEVLSNSTWLYQLSSIHNTYIISGLHPFYEYSISVAAYTVALGPFSMTVVTTSQDVPAGPPINFTANVTSSISALLQWRAPNSELINGIIKYYQINVKELETGLFTSSSSNESSYFLSNLHPFYHYECNVEAVTIGPGPSTENITFQTSEDVPSASPTGTHATNITSTSAHISWNPPPVEYHNGILTGYTVQLFEGETLINIIITANTTLTLTLLKPFKHYKYTVSADTSQGQGPVSNYTSFQTQQSAPSSPPFNISVSAISSTSFNLQWQAPSNEQLNGELTGFTVFVKELNSGINYTNTTSSAYITLDSLHPYYTYNVSVAAVTVSSGPMSLVVSITTNEDVPNGFPSSIIVTGIKSQDAVISWSPPLLNQTNGIIQYYDVNVFELESSQYYNLQSTNLSLVLSNLHPFYRYTVQVAAVTIAVGPYSPNITFRTLQDIPSGAPQELHSTVISSMSIFIQWKPIQLSMTNGLVIFYNITLIEMDTNSTFGTWIIDRLNLTVNYLHPYYFYKTYVAGSTVIGTGPFAESEALTHPSAPSAAPQNLQVNIINSTVVHLEWLSPPLDQQNGPISYYTILIYNYQTDEIEHYNSSFLFLYLSDLHPFYKYNCTVSTFTIAPGPTIAASFQTAEDIPTGQPINTTVTALNYSALLISWSPPLDSHQNGVIRHYIISLQHNITKEITTFIVVNDTEVVINNLLPFTVYTITLAAYTIGVGPYTTPVTVRLPESAPSAAPKGLTVEILSNTTDLHLSWVIPSEDSLNGLLLGYRLRCTEQYGDILSATITGTSATLQHAHINTHYTCYVCAFTSAGCGPNAITHISTYMNSPVGPPHSLSANTTTTSIDLLWEPPFDPEFLILNYVITYRIVSSSFPFTTPRPWVTVTNINETYHRLVSLVVSSNYEVKVFAVTEATTGPSSPSLVVSTTSPDHSSPQNLKCNPTSSTSLSCSWSPPVMNDYEVQNYILSYKLLDGFDFYSHYGITLEELIIHPSTTEYIINGLLPYGGYIIKVESNLTSVIASGFSGEFLSSFNEEFVKSTTVANTTHPEIPSGTVENIILNVTSPKSMIVSWKPPMRRNWRGIINSYRLTLIRNDPATSTRHKRVQPLTANFIVLPKANHPDPSIASEPLKKEKHLLDNLEENFKYTVLLAVTNAAGSGVASDPLVATMPQAAPSGPPVNITLKMATSSSVNITWQPPSPIDANGVITGFEVIFTRIEINDVTQYTLIPDQSYFYKNGLHSHEQITIQVAATTIIGRGPYSYPIYFYTNEEIPGPPQSLKATLLNDTSVLLNWNPPLLKGNTTINYQLIYIGYSQFATRNIDGPYSQNINETMAEITALLPGFFYQFQVRASNTAGYSINATLILAIPANEIITTTDSAEGFTSENLITIAVPAASALLVIVVCILMTTCILLVVRNSKRSGKKKFNSEPVVTVNPLTNLPVDETGPVVPLRSMQLQVNDNNYEELPFNQEIKLDDLTTEKSTNKESQIESAKL